jgi:glycosyltransferase involved in cell wall biosynthesis
VPAVSVVVATHDQGRWLGEALASVVAQRFADWECVVVDDGSTDDTERVVAGFAHDRRIRYLRTDRVERAAARNRGLAETAAPLVAFLDADDRWHPEKLTRQVAALADAPEAAFCYTITRFVDAAGRPLDVRKPPRALAGRVFPEMLRANFVILASVVARRARLEAVGGFDATLPVLGCEDWDLWLRLTRRWPVEAVDEELTFYRRHGANTGWDRVMTSGLAVVDRQYALPGTAAAAGLSHRAARARVRWYHAGALEGGRAQAATVALRAFLEAPGTAASRPALGALAALCLPAAAARALRRLPGVPAQRAGSEA